jgi:hypothetical protein
MDTNVTPATATAAPNAGKAASPHKVGLIALTLLVISAMVGGGVFNLPQNMAQSASLVAVLLAWLISGLGVFFLARTFQALADVKPELKSGIYSYSSVGFGKYAGFQIAWGYWLSSAFGNVGFGVLLMDTINYFDPPYFQGGNTWEAVLGASAVFWVMNWLVLRGMRGASALNVIGTIAKFIPIFVFIAVVALAMKAGLWTSAFWGNVNANVSHAKPLGSLLVQVKSTMLVTLWVFIGIEGAVVMSDKSDAKTVSRATLLGFLVTTALYVLVSILPFGVETQAMIAAINGGDHGYDRRQMGRVFHQCRRHRFNPFLLAGMDPAGGRTSLGRRQGWQLSPDFRQDQRQGRGLGLALGVDRHHAGDDDPGVFFEQCLERDVVDHRRDDLASLYRVHWISLAVNRQRPISGNRENRPDPGLDLQRARNGLWLLAGLCRRPAIYAGRCCVFCARQSRVHLGQARARAEGISVH